jgi:hypothetical protein
VLGFDRAVIDLRLRQLLKDAPGRPSLRTQVSFLLSGLRRLMFYLTTPNEALPDVRGPYAVLFYARWFNLPPACAPPHYDWVTWTRASGQIAADVELWAQNGEAVPADHATYRQTRLALPAFATSGAYRRFQAALVLLTMSMLARWLVGDWRSALLLRDVIEAEHARRAEHLASAYFFLPQLMADRPLWTFVAEQRGSRVCLVMYSHNFQVVFPSDRPNAIVCGPAYARTRWPQAIVITPGCKTVLTAAGATIDRYTVAGDVSTVDAGVRIELPRKPLVAVIDIDPASPYPDAYQSRDVVLSFLDRVSAIIVAEGAVPVWKPKGALLPEHCVAPSDLRPDADDCLAIARRYGAIICPAGSPIQWLADNVRAGIVMPFTTPATTFRLHGRDAVYFDVTGKLNPGHIAARGIEVMSDNDKLAVWLRAALASSEDMKKANSVGHIDDPMSV